jgi:hypothetical protein
LIGLLTDHRTMAHSVENPTIRTKNYTTPGDATRA